LAEANIGAGKHRVSSRDGFDSGRHGAPFREKEEAT
jgi:hypothetical protein